MSAHFKKVSPKEIGYDPASVDPVIELARKQFANPESRALDAATLRNSAFKLVKGGYQIASVDAALERLDDAFVEQEAKLLLERGGHEAAAAHLNGIRNTLQARIDRPSKQRFNRTKPWVKGYSLTQVDSLLVRIDGAIEGKRDLSAADLREVTFAPKARGYSEAQVDAFIDRTVQFLQLRKTLG